MVGTKVLGEGHFGEVRLGGVMIEGEVSKAAIKNLKGTSHRQTQIITSIQINLNLT